VAELKRQGLLATSETPTPRELQLADLQKLPHLTNVCKV